MKEASGELIGPYPQSETSTESRELVRLSA